MYTPCPYIIVGPQQLLGTNLKGNLKGTYHTDHHNHYRRCHSHLAHCHTLEDIADAGCSSNNPANLLFTTAGITEICLRIVGSVGTRAFYTGGMSHRLRLVRHPCQGSYGSAGTTTGRTTTTTSSSKARATVNRLSVILNVNNTTNGIYHFFSFVVLVVVTVPVFFVSLLRTILWDEEQPNSNNPPTK